MDVIAVIGGGVAGLATVRALQRAGHTPLLISPAHARFANRGELLGPRALAPLITLDWRHLLDDEQVAMPAEARFSAWGTPALLRHAGDPDAAVGWHIDRTRLESAMRASIAAHPARHRAASLLTCERRANGWRLALSTGEVLHARFIVDCSGRAATVTRRHGGPRRRDGHLVAMHRTLPLPASSVMAASMVESAPDGWWYTAPMPGKDRIFAAYFTDADLLPAPDGHRGDPWAGLLAGAPYTRARLDSLGSGGMGAPPEIAVAFTSSRERASGDGWVAAGDAAVALDPLAGHGLTVALWSAVQAAAAAGAWVNGDTGPLRTYQHALTAGLARFAVDAKRHYLAERRFPERRFWTRRQQHAVPADPPGLER